MLHQRNPVSYLSMQALELYVFDEDDGEEAGPGYLGLAQVPLLPLSHSKPINGTFQLKQVGSTCYA
jgi:hypothetical protein